MEEADVPDEAVARRTRERRTIVARENGSRTQERGE